MQILSGTKSVALHGGCREYRFRLPCLRGISASRHVGAKKGQKISTCKVVWGKITAESTQLPQLPACFMLLIVSYKLEVEFIICKTIGIPGLRRRSGTKAHCGPYTALAQPGTLAGQVGIEHRYHENPSLAEGFSW
jgi:hypothetical protein